MLSFQFRAKLNIRTVLHIDYQYFNKLHHKKTPIA
jgi:hypothetical protein